MRKLIFILLLFLFSGYCAAGSEVVIRGVFPGGEGREVRLMTYEDLVSNRASELDASRIGEDAFFEFRFEPDAPRLLFLRVMRSNHYFFVEPGGRYAANFVDLPSLPAIGPAARQFELKLSSQVTGPYELNELIFRLEQMVAGYLESNVAGRVRTSHQRSLEAFRLEAEEAFREVEHPFFRDHLDYYFASLQRSLNTARFHTLFEKYIEPRPIAYQHPMAMDFMGSMFGKYLLGGASPTGLDELRRAINRYGSHRVVMDLLAADSLLANERLRELVMLMGVKGMLSEREFDKMQLLGLLEETAVVSPVAEHRLIARNLVSGYRQMRPGFPPPALTLPDQQGRMLDLEDFSGSYVYLFFWDGDCPVSQADIAPMQALAAMATDSLQLLGVLTGDRPPSSGPLSDPSGLGFPLLYAGDDHRLLDSFRLRSTPQYILIGPDGNVLFYPFASPSGGAALQLPGLTGRGDDR